MEQVQATRTEAVHMKVPVLSPIFQIVTEEPGNLGLEMLTDTSVGHEYIEARLLGQDLVCSFLYGSEAVVITTYPGHLGGQTSRLDVRDGLPSSSLLAAGDVYSGGVATGKHLYRSSAETIRAWEKHEQLFLAWEEEGAGDLPPVMSSTLPVSSGTSRWRSKSSFTILVRGLLPRGIEPEAECNRCEKDWIKLQNFSGH